MIYCFLHLFIHFICQFLLRASVWNIKCFLAIQTSLSPCLLPLVYATCKSEWQLKVFFLLGCKVPWYFLLTTVRTFLSCQLIHHWSQHLFQNDAHARPTPTPTKSQPKGNGARSMYRQGRQSDGWEREMDGRTDGWTDGWMDGRMHGCMDKR